jgi:predicted AAA+ superfamily ATPase
VFYWRDKNREVDYVIRVGGVLTAVEVKSGRTRDARPGLAAFAQIWKPKRTLLVGRDGIALEEFLSKPVEHWTGP